ncbi:MAG: enoyl-CoA hydratase [Desulfobacteraceae bacterium]|nr:MAG: enoyl-CoA hydratase [Desulfobacteraceae bacterium]
MEWTQTQYEIEDGIAIVTLNRPERLNAFTKTMRTELVEIFRAADQDDAVRVVVVKGAGKAFCAGADLSSGSAAFERAMQEGRKVSQAEHRDGGGQVSLAIFNCRKPVIGAINGHAVGVGITMTLPMDLRIVSEDAKIGFVFARRGVVPEACSAWFLPRIVGISKAAEWIYTGRIFRASEEADSGLFNYVVPPDGVIEKAMSVAREIAENTSAVSVALGKALLWHAGAEPDPQSTHLIDSKCFYWAGLQRDSREGVQSFLEKRKPRFTMKVSTDMPDFYPWWKEPKV